jgi:hypothetical protein
MRKKWLRRVLAVGCGLALGWMAGGSWPTLSTGVAASPGAPVSQPVTADASAAGHRAGDVTGEASGGTAGAGQLVPAAGTTPWLGPVLWTAAGLFVAAAVVGLLLRGAGVRDPSIVAGETDLAQAGATHQDEHHDTDSAVHEPHA